MYTYYYIFVLIYNQTSGRFAFCLSRVTIIVTKNNNMLFLTRKYKLQQFIFYMKMNKTYYIRYNVMFSIEHYLFKLSHDARHQELAGADWSILAPFIFSERMWKWTRSSCCKIKNLERRIALLIGIWYLERRRDIKKNKYIFSRKQWNKWVQPKKKKILQLSGTIRWPFILVSGTIMWSYWMFCNPWESSEIPLKGHFS